MIVFLWLLLVFVTLAFLVGVANCVNQKTTDRVAEVLVTVVFFAMMLCLCFTINKLKYGGF